MSSSTIDKMRRLQTLRNIKLFLGGHNLFQTKRTYLLTNSEKKTPFCKIVILAKLLRRKMSSNTANKMRDAQTLQNINQFIGGYNLRRTRIYVLYRCEKTPFRKIVIPLKLLLCEKGKNLSLSVNYYFHTHSQCYLKLCLVNNHVFSLPYILFRFVP